MKFQYRQLIRVIRTEGQNCGFDPSLGYETEDSILLWDMKLWVGSLFWNETEDSILLWETKLSIRSFFGKRN
jgi:hypothetical protein